MHVLRLAAALSAALLLTGCAGTPRSVPSPSPVAATPRATRVGLVDLDRVAEQHPRAQELAALRRRVAETEVAMRIPLAPPQIAQPQIRDLGPRLQARTRELLEQQAAELRRTYQEELRVLERQGKEEVERFARQVQAEQQEKLTQRQEALQAELHARAEAKRKEMEPKLRAYEGEVAREYRIPLLNLRLKLEAVQHTDRQQFERLVAEYERLQREREAKVAAFQAEQQKEFEAFVKESEEQARSQMEAYRAELEAEARRRIEEREAIVRNRLREAAAARERQFREVMRARERELVSGAQGEARDAVAAARRELERIVEEARAKYVAEERARQEQLQSQLVALRTQQANLETAILAEVRIEVAAIALEQNLDVVLVRYVSHIGGVDITDQVLRRLRNKR
ncbi:MAG: hypothetical protein QN163_02755 [Armatimonadota bacterium]|nr:hypothetical protein [Armatimonadota bacterium]